MIETRYYCRIDHGFWCKKSDETQKKIEDKLFAVSSDLDLEEFALCGGTAASYPYIEFWTDDKERTRVAERVLKNILKSHRIEINP
jgi:predicted phosphohydrolase